MQNGYIESFNGKFRDKCLNEHWFETLSQARSTIASWRQDYNQGLSHGSLGRYRRPVSLHATASAEHRLPAKRSGTPNPDFRLLGMAQGGRSGKHC